VSVVVFESLGARFCVLGDPQTLHPKLYGRIPRHFPWQCYGLLWAKPVGQTGWGLHQRRRSNDACATPQRRPRHALAWMWTNFLSEQRRATGLVETAGGAVRAGGKRQPARCSRKTQDKFAIASMAKKLLHRCICAHARVHMHFLRRVCMHSDRCC